LFFIVDNNNIAVCLSFFVLLTMCAYQLVC
jgi:hypothetical protein